MHVMPAWRGASAAHFLTPAGDRWPEGKRQLAKALGLVPRSGTTLDYGCGDGRLAPFFSPQIYLGWDQNAELVKIASAAHPLHQFCTSVDGGLPDFDRALACMVFNHVPDEQIGETVRALCARRRELYLIEVLDRSYRGRPNARQGNFHRSPLDYQELALESMWFEVLRTWDAPHKGHPVSLARFTC